MDVRHPLARMAAVCGAVAVAYAAYFAFRTPGLPKYRDPDPPAAVAPSPSTTRLSPELAAALHAIESRERTASETYWAKELLAQSCGRIFEVWWDSVRTSSNRLIQAAHLPVGEILLPDWNTTTTQSLPHAITVHIPETEGRTLSGPEWTSLATGLSVEGWELDQCEVRHRRFEVDDTGRPRLSVFSFSAHLTRSNPLLRADLTGELDVHWPSVAALNPQTNTPSPLIGPQRIDASRVSLRSRPGPAPFQLVLDEVIVPSRHWQSIDPVIVHDLGGDGFAEILLPAQNLLFRRHTGQYRAETLLTSPADSIQAAVLADFDRDGLPDLLAADRIGLQCFPGSPHGGFQGPPRLAWPAPPDLVYPMVLTCGDIDADGDLDVFLAQYKDPYEGGATPTPFHDARDGNPAYLLINNGSAQFTEETGSRGLAPKRSRRTYAASFVDIDQDGSLDLAVVSDFAGLDLYRNEGNGRFTDVTDLWTPESHGFGMSLAWSDFNSDGALDLLMLGMGSPTVERLNHLGLWRPGPQDDPTRHLRTRMTAGNQLYLGAIPPRAIHSASRSPFDDGTSTLADSIAMSGWSWGCAAADFDLDGFPDLYIANGLESRQTVAEYEPEYWLHDQFVGTSEANPAAYLYFQTRFAQTRGSGQSYGGFEKNRFFLNQGGASFFEAGHLLGVAIEQDSRNVVAEDVDLDGRPDLIVTSFEPWPSRHQRLRVYRNQLQPRGHWIGFRLNNEETSLSATGARVVIRCGTNSATRAVVTGDSYRSQSSATVHFGLEAAEWVDLAEVSWANGSVSILTNLASDRYHPVPSPRAIGRSPSRNHAVGLHTGTPRPQR